MDELGHYIRIHLTGSAGGIELFSRGKGLTVTDGPAVTSRIRQELVEERSQLLAMADRLDVRTAPLATIAAKVGERVGRLKPNGNPLKRSPMTDLIDLEAMRVAVSGKTAGWDSLLSVVDQHDGLDRDELNALRDQALRQLDELSALHRAAAAQAITR